MHSRSLTSYCIAIVCFIIPMHVYIRILINESVMFLYRRCRRDYDVHRTSLGTRLKTDEQISPYIDINRK